MLGDRSERGFTGFLAIFTEILHYIGITANLPKRFLGCPPNGKVQASIIRDGQARMGGCNERIGFWD